MAQTIYASFPNTDLADKAAGALMDYGVRGDDISLIAGSNNPETRDFAAHSATLEERRMPATGAEYPGAPMVDASARPGYSEGMPDVEASRAYGTSGETSAWYRDRDAQIAEDREYDDREETHNDLNARSGITTTTPGDAASGAAKGAGVGLVAGVIASLAALAVPGVGLVAGGGALATAIAGTAAATAGGAVAGGVEGYLKDQGVPDTPAMDFDRTVRNGGAVLAVACPSNNVDQATIESVLNKYQANNVSNYGAYAA